jgi:EmrB/QacA subfamily drug resistance transporter
VTAEAAAQPPEDQLERRHWLTLLATSVGVLMVVMDSTIVNVALPVIREDLGFLEVSVEELQWVVNAYALSFAVLLLSAGKLADLFGRKRLFVIGLVLFVAASAACGTANEINVLIGFRALQGVGAALIMPTTLSIIQVSFPMSKLGMAIGIWSAIVGVGTAIGPLAGGILAEEIDWRWVFYINLPIGIATLVATIISIRESRGELEDRSIDYGGALLSGTGLFAMTYALLKANDFGWGDPRTLGLLAAGILLLVLFTRYERTRSAPMLDLSLFRSRTFAGANGVAVLVGFALFGLLFYGSLMIQGVMGFSATETGLSQLPMMGMIILMGPIVGKRIGTVGPGPLLTIGMAALVLSFLCFYPLDFGSNFWDLLPGMVLGGFGFASVLTPLTAAALSGVPFQQAGMGAAAINSTRQIGGALGLAVMGAISAQQISASLLDGQANPEGFVDGFGLLMFAGAGVTALGSIIAWVAIAKPARAAAKVAAAEAAAAPPEPEPALAAPPPAAQEIGVEHSRSWAVAGPSVINALPAALADRAAGDRAGAGLEVVEGPAAGMRISIGADGLVLGRGESGAGTLGNDAELSRRHVSISPADGRLLVEDLGSTNGTIVNGSQISTPTPAEPGDSISVGSSVLRVLAPPPRPAAPAGLAIRVVEGPAAGTTIPVGTAPVVFGRAEEGAGSLGGDPELSRRHASASVLDGGRLLVEDLGSTNGTFVKDHRIVAPTVLGPGDGLSLGASVLEVVASDREPAPA